MASAAEERYEAEEFEQAVDEARRAAAKLSAAGDAEQLARALRVEIMALIGQDKLVEAASAAKQHLDAQRAAGNRWGEAMMLLSAGNANMDKQGAKKCEEAALCAQEAQSMFQALGAKKWVAEALHVMAFCASKGSDKAKAGKEATAFAQQARELCVELGDKRLEGRSMHFLAEGHFAAGDLQACTEAAEEQLDLFIELRDKRLEAFATMSLAQWHLRLGNFDRALSDAEDALDIYSQIKSPRERQVLSLIFEAYMGKGDRRRALRAAKEGVKRYKARDDRAGEGAALDLLVSAYITTDQLSDALDAAQRAMTLSQDTGNQHMEARMLNAIAGIHLRTGQLDSALQSGEDAVAGFRECGGQTGEKTEAMLNVVEAFIQKKDHSSALQAASEMRAHFQKVGDVRGESSALMTMGQISLEMQQPDEAVASVSKAQAMLGEDGQQFGEATALRLLADALSRKDDHKQALRSAERARAIFRELGESSDEASALYLVSQEAVAIAVSEGAQAGGGAPSRAASDALIKAQKSADMGIKLARELQANNGILGSILCITAQVHMLNSKPEEALAAADEAVVLFREIGSAISEANALLLSADALRVVRQYRDSGDAAEEALRLFRSLESPEPKGEEYAQEVLDYLESVKKQQQQAQMQQAQMQAVPMGMTAASSPEGGGVPDQVVSMARQERARGAALDMKSGVDISVIKAKVQEIATRITGAEDGEIDMDTPLMEAGLTSNSALVLRDNLIEEMPGVQLPVTLVFDYPSIGAMADLIVENSGGKAIGN